MFRLISMYIRSVVVIYEVVYKWVTDESMPAVGFFKHMGIILVSLILGVIAMALPLGAVFLVGWVFFK